MNILFMGLIYNPADEDELLASTNFGLGFASNLLQWNTINSLINGSKNDVSVLSSLPVGNYPKLNKKIFYSKKKYSLNRITVNETKSINLPLIKHFFRYSDFKKNINNWYNEIHNTDKKIIIMYDLYNPFLNLIPHLQKKYNDLKIIVMIPDLIGNYRNDVNIKPKLKLKFKKNNDQQIKKLNFADGFIMITDQISDVIIDDKKPRVVVNGIVSDNNMKNNHQFKANGKIIYMYSGLLSNQYHIGELIGYFNNYSGGNIELWICGYGDFSADLINKKYNNVIYFGVLSKKEVVELEKKADILINPRPNNGLYTKYSFPSKNLEYLLSGKPVICYKLDGISSEYENVFDYIDDYPNGLDDIVKKYNNINQEEYNKICDFNRKFVLKNNGIISQGKKIIKLLENIVDK